MKPEIAIIGGGYAGLACAVALARSERVRVTVFESGRVLGGRARVVARQDPPIDNGQHLLIGAYTQLLQMMRQVGVPPRVLESLPLTIAYPDGFELRAARLPAPFHLAVGLARARGLGWRDRVAAAKLIHGLRRRGWQVSPDRPVARLLAELGQTTTLRDRLWEPLCVAALNTPAIEASAQVFANVLRDSLAAGSASSELLIPRIDLSELFPVPATRWLGRRGHGVRTSDPIRAIRVEDDVFWLDGGPTWAGYNQVVVATAPYHAAPLLAPFPALAGVCKSIDGLDHQPITTIYLHYEKSPMTGAPMTGLTGGPAQWLFDRGRLGGPPGLLAAVVSARSPFDDQPHEALELAVQRQLEQAYGRLPPPAWIRTIAERRATFSCTPDLARPGNQTPMPGLWLAGDYTHGPYPATLEGAVRSGLAAARGVLATLD
ncbi:MAG: FAD-dependent oxidoreductase [Zoogloeaceae bacterium]|nr:hydroxysqualene dehydroxylase HpnE [Rhodocyclaceae bacterium]MCP5235563.1 FAD-dependent oxidoreductase [Zoogloeaceae bacterium]